MLRMLSPGNGWLQNFTSTDSCDLIVGIHIFNRFKCLNTRYSRRFFDSKSEIYRLPQARSRGKPCMDPQNYTECFARKLALIGGFEISNQQSSRKSVALSHKFIGSGSSHGPAPPFLVYAIRSPTALHANAYKCIHACCHVLSEFMLAWFENPSRLGKHARA